jgi:hypothetical protein
MLPRTKSPIAQASFRFMIVSFAHCMAPTSQVHRASCLVHRPAGAHPDDELLFPSAKLFSSRDLQLPAIVRGPL